MYTFFQLKLSWLYVSFGHFMLAQVRFDVYLWDAKLENVNNNESVSILALFRFFNLSRIQDNAILTFLNTSNDLSTTELPHHLIITLNLFICSLYWKWVSYRLLNTKPIDIFRLPLFRFRWEKTMKRSPGSATIKQKLKHVHKYQSVNYSCTEVKRPVTIWNNLSLIVKLNAK